jgi:hypothetical protein
VVARRFIAAAWGLQAAPNEIDAEAPNVFGDILSLIIGISLIIFRRQYSRYVMDMQNRTWGTHSGTRDIKITEVVTLIVGAGFIAIAILSILQII